MNANANLTNPKTVENRIYVGNLGQAVTSEHLTQKFLAYGQIIGISKKASATFGFIEYRDTISALKAIEVENGTNLMGRKVTVKKVNVKSSNVTDNYIDKTGDELKMNKSK